MPGLDDNFDEDFDLNLDTEREEDVGPTPPEEPPMIDLVETERKIRDFFSKD